MMINEDSNGDAICRPPHVLADDRSLEKASRRRALRQLVAACGKAWEAWSNARTSAQAVAALSARRKGRCTRTHTHTHDAHTEHARSGNLSCGVSISRDEVR